MTPTERAKRSDALYYETVSVTRRVLCDMIANREADLDDLRESVKRLMTQRDERLARAEAENAKLRELVRTLANCASGRGCDYCPINGGHGYIDETDMCESVHDCMRELGIEVEG